MASESAERFMHALQDAERTRDVGPLVARFTADAELSNLSGKGPHTGPDGARTFWREYLDFFEAIRSEFTHVTEGPDRVVLEWASEGALRGGSPVRYRGVSVLELVDGLVRRFRTYYDSAALGPVVVARAEG